MKKLLSLLLAMLLCLGVLVACDTPEESSSSSSSKASSSEFSTEMVFPVVPHQVKIEYAHYNVVVNEVLVEASENFQKWIFNDYSAFGKFASTSFGANIPSSLNEEIFEDNFIIAIYRKHDFFRENYCYGDFYFDSNDSKYSITFEYTVYPDKLQDQMIVPDSIDIVVVPKAECDKVVSEENILIKALEHKYTYKSYIVE